MEAKKELTQEIASIERDVLRMSYFGDILTPDDDTLLTRGGAKGLKIYDEIERDCHAYAVLQKRKMAVIGRPWDVLPASNKRLDKKAAEVVKDALDALPFDRICLDLLDANLKGYAVGEVMWAERDGLLLPYDVLARDQRRFVFDTQSRLRHLTQAAPSLGEALPDRKFIVHRFGGKAGNPYGLGLGTRLFWPVFFKRKDISFWLVFADKFGSPTATGKYPQGASPEEKKKLLSVLKSLSQDTGIIIPEGMIIELLEASRSGSTDAYERLARYMDEQISEAVLGETMSTSAQGAGLGSTQAGVHNEVRKELAQADADLLSDTLNATLVKWITELNVPGAKPPTVWRDFSEPEDLQARKNRAESDEAILRLGYRPTPDYIRETYGEGFEPVAPAGQEPSQVAFAEGEAGDELDALAALMESDWERTKDPILAPILALRDRCASLEEFRDSLPSIIQDMDVSAFAEGLAQGQFAANVWGRVNATEADA
jgi:phage gp29-like protein